MKTDPSCRPWLARQGALAVLLACAGCAGAPPVPEAQLALGRGAINEALSAGAAEAAPLELKQARDKMARADAAVAAENYEEARRLAEEAEVDARLASARARTAQAKLAAREIENSLSTLRENLNTGAEDNAPAPR